MKRALITGISGQDGSYLAEFLLSKGYQVIGMVRRSTTTLYERIEHIQELITIVQGDMFDQSTLSNILEIHQPDEVYNLAAQSFVHASWDQAVLVGEISALGTTRLLEAVRQVNKKIKFYQASSSEIFGSPQEVPQTETTRLNPRNPYGTSKAYSHMIANNYRDYYDMFICCGILYNHESPRRGFEFVTRKISHGAAQIKSGKANELRLGNLEARRDWGFAGDYVRAMWLMLNQPTPDDYVVGSGVTHSVRDFCETAFHQIGLDYSQYVVQDQCFFHQADQNILVSNPAKAHQKLGWNPAVSFEEMVKMMVEADLNFNS